MLPSLHDGLAPLMSPWSGTCLVRLQRGFGILCLWDTLLILYLYFVPLFLEGFPKLSSVKNVEAAPFSSLPRREDNCPGPPGPPALPSTHHTTRPLLSGPEAPLQDL